MDTVLFLNIGKPDVFELKSLVFFSFFIRETNNYRIWLSTYLIFSAIDFRLTNIQRLYIYMHYQYSGRALYPYILQILDEFASDISICTGNRYIFCINRI
jgi:hypothetical protein